MPSANASGSDPSREALLRALFADLPTEYIQRCKAVAAVRRAFYQQIASSLQGPLNEHLATLPQETTEERRELAGWVNQHLRFLGLAVAAPTGEPARLVVDTQDAEHPDVSRYRYGVRYPSGRSRNLGSSRTLPELELLEAEPRVESLSMAFLKTGKDGPTR